MKNLLFIFYLKSCYIRYSSCDLFNSCLSTHSTIYDCVDLMNLYGKKILFVLIVFLLLSPVLWIGYSFIASPPPPKGSWYSFTLTLVFSAYSGTALGVVIYTGRETRSVMNTSSPESKVAIAKCEYYFYDIFSPSLSWILPIFKVSYCNFCIWLSNDFFLFGRCFLTCISRFQHFHVRNCHRYCHSLLSIETFWI